MIQDDKHKQRNYIIRKIYSQLSLHRIYSSVALPIRQYVIGKTNSLAITSDTLSVNTSLFSVSYSVKRTPHQIHLLVL